jgi:hypothetical protein
MAPAPAPGPDPKDILPKSQNIQASAAKDTKTGDPQHGTSQALKPESKYMSNRVLIKHS